MEISVSVPGLPPVNKALGEREGASKEGNLLKVISEEIPKVVLFLSEKGAGFDSLLSMLEDEDDSRGQSSSNAIHRKGRLDEMRRGGAHEIDPHSEDLICPHVLRVVDPSTLAVVPVAKGSHEFPLLVAYEHGEFLGEDSHGTVQYGAPGVWVLLVEGGLLETADQGLESGTLGGHSDAAF